MHHRRHGVSPAPLWLAMALAVMAAALLVADAAAAECTEATFIGGDADYCLASSWEVNGETPPSFPGSAHTLVLGADANVTFDAATCGADNALVEPVGGVVFEPGAQMLFEPGQSLAFTANCTRLLVEPATTATSTASTTTSTSASASASTTGNVETTGESSKGSGESAKSDSSDSTLLIVAGAAVGGVLLACACCAGCLVQRNKRRRDAAAADDTFVPMEQRGSSDSTSMSSSQANLLVASAGAGGGGGSDGGGGAAQHYQSPDAPLGEATQYDAMGSNDSVYVASLAGSGGEHYAASPNGGGGGESLGGDSGNGWEIPYGELTFEEKIGSGSFGQVWKAKWRRQSVAVKQLLERLEDTELEAFRSEASLMSQLRPSPHVVLFLGVCSAPNQPLAIVTEYCPGGSLYDLLSSQRPMDLSMIVSFGLDIAAGMLHLHSENVIHRDLACRNVLLNSNNNAKITDFGLSRTLQDAADRASAQGKTEQASGPLKHMAPECIMSQTYSVKSDSWSFGVCMIELLTRREPYPGMKPVKVAILVTTAQKTPDIPDICPPPLATLLARCFAQAPADRPGMAAIHESMQAIKFASS